MVMRYVHVSGDHADTAIANIETGSLGGVAPELHTATSGAKSVPAKIIPIKRWKINN